MDYENACAVFTEAEADGNTEAILRSSGGVAVDDYSEPEPKHYIVEMLKPKSYGHTELKRLIEITENHEASLSLHDGRFTFS
jgi:hypothetical protein